MWDLEHPDITRALQTGYPWGAPYPYEPTEAHWVYSEYDIPHCSNCGYEAFDGIEDVCPYCGAEMEDDE